MAQEIPDKPTRGWYGSRVKEISVEFAEMNEQFDSLYKLVHTFDELATLRDHPMLLNYTSFYDRFRRIEITMDTLVNKIAYFESRIAAAERAVQTLTRPERRGA